MGTTVNTRKRLQDWSCGDIKQVKCATVRPVGDTSPAMGMDMVVRWMRVSRSAVVEVEGRGKVGGSEVVDAVESESP